MSKEHPAVLFRPYTTNPERAFSTARRSPDLRAAVVFLDTNVLLAPYRSSSEALDAIQATYAQLCSEKRLVVPAQVAREFARNRPTLIAQLHKSVRDARSHTISGRFDAPPILQGLQDYQTARKALAAIDTELKNYRKALADLALTIEHWEHNDPVLQVYAPLFDSSVVIDHGIDSATLESIRKSRYDARIPPGFRDKAKDDGGVGDLAIWLTILDTCAAPPRDAILVTEDSKDDWFHSSQDQRLFPRYELVEEFALRAPGKAFGLTSLASLLRAHGAPETVVDEVAQHERIDPQFSGARAYSLRAQFADYAVARLSATAGTDVTIERSRKWPTIRLLFETGLVGLEIVPIHGLLAGGDVFALANESILYAQKMLDREPFAELVVVFVTESLSAGVLLRSWFAENARQGPHISIIVSVYSNRLFATLLNLSEDPVVGLAFGRTLPDE